MRKYNSEFKTAFISEEGSKLKNNDYFGFVELDKYACYVIADGITDVRDSESAKRAIEAVVTAFQNAPGMSKGKIKSYLRFANKELLTGKSYEKLKASLTVVVSDYEKFRYGYAGNTRLRLYRNGKKILATADMSLSQDMVKEGEVAEDKLAEHEERNNLTSYLGMEKYKPFVSGKIKLADGDIIALYTKGIWENVDEGEIADVFEEVGNEPEEECNKVEDLLLSRQPENLDNYTFAAIYANKVFVDPNRKKNIRKIIIIVVVILVIVLVVGLILYLWRRDRLQKRADMEQAFSNTETYMEDHNFIRAKEECEKAMEFAQKLRNKELQEKYNEYLICLEAVISADDLWEKAEYMDAKEAYLTAKARARYADNSMVDYIESRLDEITDYEQIFDNITMGDSLLALQNFELAEEKYLEAKKKAASIYFAEGKQQALDALDKLYAEWSVVIAEQDELAAELAADEVAAADLVKQGDAAYSESDYDGAMVFYLIALGKYTELEDAAQIASLNQKIIALNEKQEEVGGRVNEAEQLEEQARIYEAGKEYEQAKIQYQYAKAIYEELGKSNKANEVQGRIDLIDTKTAQDEKAEKEKADEEKAEKEKAEQAQAEKEKAESEKEQAEAERAKAEAEAEAERIKAEAEAERIRAEAEAEKIKAEAEAEKIKAETEKIKAETEAVNGGTGGNGTPGTP
ncbi:MAG: hypothetical protein NC118_03510 [Eubacterium sp.]|nr:hypothetical protein [Eubacterium sp.]